MRCCADVLVTGSHTRVPGWRLALALAFVLLAATACDASAQNAARLEAEPSAAMTAGLLDRLRTEVAARWGVAVAQVHVEWSSPEDAATLAQDAGFRMIGGGSDGVWFIDVDGAEGRATRLRMRAGSDAVLPVAARDLERGTTLTDADIARESTVQWGAPARQDHAVEAGWVTRRRIARGETLAEPGVTAPNAVEAGDNVRIVYAHGPIELVLAGRAAGSGALGEKIAVRADTGRRLEGVIVAPGTVKVDSGVIRR
jgi:flagella basal body P-ring formation protein FlgA